MFYLEDTHAWALQAAADLRAGRPVDTAELIGHLDAVASGLERELDSISDSSFFDRMELDFGGLDEDDNSRLRAELNQAESSLLILLHAVPSLRETLDEIVAETFADAKQEVIADLTVISKTVQLPEADPYVQRVVGELDREFAQVYSS